jgi:plasmid maintenance system antidote protein VapI
MVARGMSQTAMARALGMQIQQFNAVYLGKNALSFKMTLKIADVFGGNFPTYLAHAWAEYRLQCHNV